MGKKIFLGIVIILALAAGVGYFMPNSATAEASITIEKPTSEVGQTVSNLHSWLDWSTLGKDHVVKGTRVNFGVNAMGEGGTVGYSDPVPEGEREVDALMTITKADEDHIAYRVEFSGVKTEPFLGEIRFSGGEGSTTVNWRLTYNNQTPVIGSYLVMLNNAKHAEMLRTSLAGLKALLEKGEKIGDKAAKEAEETKTSTEEEENSEEESSE